MCENNLQDEKNWQSLLEHLVLQEKVVVKENQTEVTSEKHSDQEQLNDRERTIGNGSN
ncbi:hypothetical protein ACR77M_22075 [Enterococcus avium]|uniref:hypothetical protein n=1 Tax=Enterococcus avium TaxID=33945 RepID=UPI003DA66D90